MGLLNVDCYFTVKLRSMKIVRLLTSIEINGLLRLNTFVELGLCVLHYIVWITLKCCCTLPPLQHPQTKKDVCLTRLFQHAKLLNKLPVFICGHVGW